MRQRQRIFVWAEFKYQEFFKDTETVREKRTERERNRKTEIIKR